MIEALHAIHKAWNVGVGVYAKGGKLSIDGDLTGITPELATLLVNHQQHIVNLFTDPNQRSMLRRALGESQRWAEQMRRNNQSASWVGLTQLGKFWYNLAPLTQDDLTPDERVECDKCAAQLVASEDGYAADTFAHDLTRRWGELSERDRLLAVYAWELAAHPPPLSLAA